MRIYQVNTEHTKHGLNWGSVKVAAKSFEQAVRQVKKTLKRGERIESVYILASED